MKEAVVEGRMMRRGQGRSLQVGLVGGQGEMPSEQTDSAGQEGQWECWMRVEAWLVGGGWEIGSQVGGVRIN